MQFLVGAVSHRTIKKEFAKIISAAPTTTQYTTTTPSFSLRFRNRAYKKKKWKLPVIGNFHFFRVELVGFEPTSKQGNHTLSTRLFRPSVFVLQQDPDHQLQPYPLKFHPGGEAHPRLFPIYLHRLAFRFGTTSLERCLVLASNAGIKPIYYTSIRQRERSCFRQLNF